MAQQEISLALQEREIVGKGVKHLRQDGLVPAVIHDHGKPSVHVMAPYTEVMKAYQQAGGNHPVQLKVGKKQYLAMIKDTDFEPRKHMLRHVVFNAVKANEKVEAEVPVHVKYDEGNDASPAERTGLIVLRGLETVEVKALPANLPEVLEFDGEKLVQAGDNVTVAELTIPEGVEVLTDADQVLATVYEPSALAAANDAAGGEAEAENLVTSQEIADGVSVEATAEKGEKSE